MSTQLFQPGASVLSPGLLAWVNSFTAASLMPAGPRGHGQFRTASPSNKEAEHRILVSNGFFRGPSGRTDPVVVLTFTPPPAGLPLPFTIDLFIPTELWDTSRLDSEGVRNGLLSEVDSWLRSRKPAQQIAEKWQRTQCVANFLTSIPPVHFKLPAVSPPNPTVVYTNELGFLDVQAVSADVWQFRAWPANFRKGKTFQLPVRTLRSSHAAVSINLLRQLNEESNFPSLNSPQTSAYTI